MAGQLRGPGLARRRGLQAGSLEQLLQTVAGKGTLVGQRGAQGGYRLAREAAQIGVGDLVRAENRFANPNLFELFGR